MKKIFVNPSHQRMRAGWRILLFLAIFWIFSALIFVVRPLLGDINKSEYLSNYSLLIVSILALAATLATIVARKYFDKKSFVSLGLKKAGAWKDLLFGFLLSGIMAGLFLGVTMSLDLVEFQGFNFSSADFNTNYVSIMTTTSIVSMTLLLLEHILVGCWEELAFRGYLLQNMSEGMGLKLAILISCLIYGLVHIANPNATFVSSAVIVGFGFLRIYGYLTTQMLWLSMGMHIGWNYFQGPVFGFAASGHQHATLFQLNITGPDWLSGGAFGPEGSILILPILVLALFAMKRWSERRSLGLQL